jgi:hypothetical protein
MAMASQSSNLFALNAIARSSSSSYTGNRAGVSVQVADGKMLTDQNAWADKLARADEISKVWDAAGASSYSYAKNGEGDQVYSKVSANLSNGTFNSKQIALANNNLDLWHLADAGRALSTTSYAYALVRDRYLAKVYTDTKMDLGNFKTDLGANVNKTINSAASYQLFNSTETLLGSSNTLALEFAGNKSKTYANASMDKGDFNSDLSARVDAKSALAMQKTNATLADNAMAGSRAIDSQGDRARASVFVEMAGGNFDTLQKARAGADATVYQKTNATQALYGSAATKAENREGDRASTSVNAVMNSGRFNNTLGLDSEDQNVSIYHKTDATKALSASSSALAEDSDGNKAKSDVSATMASGQFNTVMDLEADGSATIYQQTNSTQALTGSAVSRAVNSDGDRANTSVVASMNAGQFNNTLGVAARDENVSIYHKADASKALTGISGAFAEDQSGNLASTSVNTTMANGLFDTIMGLEADGSAAIWQKTNATQAISGQALTLGLSKEGGRASTGVSATMDQGYFNNTLLVQAHDDQVSDYHKFNATEVLTANKNGLVQDGLGNKSSVAAALRLDHGQFDGAMDLYVDQGAEISQYLKAEKVLWGTDSAHSEDASSHKADSSLTVTNGMFSNEILARAIGNATIYHDFYAYADLIRANTSAWRPGEYSRINTTVSVNRNNVNPARLQGLQTADSNSTGTEANQYIQARGRINSEVRSYSASKTNESDLNYDSVGVDSHLWAATDALGAYSDRWTTFYLDHNPSSSD